MKRDMELMRTLMLMAEQHPKLDGSSDEVDASDFEVEGHSEREVIYHLTMLINEGFLDGSTKFAYCGAIVVMQLTWKGHDFVEAVRDPAIWNATKEGARKIGGFTFDTLLAIAKGLIKKKVEQHTGVTLDF